MKIKTYIIFLIAIYCQTILFSQAFAPVGAKWHFPTFNYIDQNVEISVFESVGDTIINNKPCKAIFKNNHSCYSSNVYHYLHQSNDSIFRYDEDLESYRLLFIQNAQVGDMWTIPESPQLELDSMYCFVDSISYFHFNSTDSLRVQHVTLRVADYISINQDGDTSYYDSDQVKIYEEIGFNIALFPVIWYTLCDAEHESQIRCYEDNDIGLINFSGVDCNFTTPNQDLYSNSKIEIYPNPATSQLFIQSDLNPIDKIELIDLQGKIIKAKINTPPSIDLTGLKNGIYILKIYLKNEIIWKKIIIKN